MNRKVFFVPNPSGFGSTARQLTDFKSMLEIALEISDSAADSEHVVEIQDSDFYALLAELIYKGDLGEIYAAREDEYPDAPIAFRQVSLKFSPLNDDDAALFAEKRKQDIARRHEAKLGYNDLVAGALDTSTSQDDEEEFDE